MNSSWTVTWTQALTSVTINMKHMPWADTNLGTDSRVPRTSAWLTFRLWLTYEDQSLYQTKNKVDVDINLTPGLHHWHKRVPSNDFVRICIWTWNFGCLFDMTIADYDSHVSIESLVSGTKTDDLESPCLSTCWSWLHVHQWLDFDWSEVTRTLLTLTWALMSQTCAWTSMIWTQTYNINHIWLASFLKRDYWGPGLSQPEQDWRTQTGAHT